MKLTERFKRVADDILQYQLTVDDPVTYARLAPFDGGRLLHYDCREGNYAILQSIGGEQNTCGNARYNGFPSPSTAFSW
jgi:hypothetical protein